MKSKQQLYITVLAFALFFSFVYFFAIPHITQAAFVTCGNEEGGSASQGCTLGDLFSTATRFVQYLFTGAGVVATLGIVYGGLKMVTSAGNDKGVAAGKKTITNSLTGLIVVLMAMVLIQAVLAFLGVRNRENVFNPDAFIQDSSQGPLPDVDTGPDGNGE